MYTYLIERVSFGLGLVKNHWLSIEKQSVWFSGLILKNVPIERKCLPNYTRLG